MSPTYNPGDVISHYDMTYCEGFSLQQGMNFRKGRGGVSVILMSKAANAPYNDTVLDDGKTIIYEGHNVRSNLVSDSVKNHDQPLRYPTGLLTENGKFYEAAKAGSNETVRVYEKIRSGIWVYNGTFSLKAARFKSDGRRRVLKFTLSILESQAITTSHQAENETLEQTRMIPPQVKLEVFKRDGGKCVLCGVSDNLHYDHILPYSRGGTSLLAENIQLLCARHNLSKSNKIQ